MNIVMMFMELDYCFDDDYVYYTCTSYNTLNYSKNKTKKSIYLLNVNCLY